MIDRDDIMEAVEVALGDTLESDGRKPQVVHDRAVARQVTLLRRVISELPDDITVSEIREALE